MAGVLKERFLRGTNNLIKLQLTEDGTPITWLNNATEVEITVGGVAVTRVSNTGGVDFTDPSILEINPALVSEAAGFSVGNQDTFIRVKTATNPQGVVFGGEDSEKRIKFDVSDPP